MKNVLLFNISCFESLDMISKDFKQQKKQNNNVIIYEISFGIELLKKTIDHPII